MTPNEGPMLSIMYFAKFEAKKFVFWKVHTPACIKSRNIE
jgi:hypothetical protein